ncbi:MAG: c-type cytochrome [Anaerolineales bacterium]|nr:c-type cytochrome [Anaerolineales bacterium]
MNFRSTLFVAIIVLLLTACNMTLAQDVTPPPGAVQPAQEQPIQGPVFPAQAPDLQNGAAIYTEKCAACHGESGQADGVMSEQLAAQGVTVPALGSTEVAGRATPASWFLTVTLGNMEKLMPPFNSLSDQERWDVVAYAQSLSTTPDQISQGKEFFSKNCVNCPTDFFSDQEAMAALSTDDLVSMLAQGGEGLPDLAGTLSQDELRAVAIYLRTLTFSASPLAFEPASPTATAVPAQTETSSTEAPGTEISSAEATPLETEQVEGTPEATIVLTGSGPVSGMLLNGSGGETPTGATVTLHGFNHSTDPNSTPQEVITQTVKTDESGAFLFEDVDLQEGRIFLVEANYQGITFQSDLAISEAGMTELTIPDVTVYDSTTDSGGLVVEQLHVSFDMAVEGGVQVFELFTISNLSNKAYVFATDGTNLPFMPLPEGASNVGLELSQDSAPLLGTESGDLAIPPSEDFYSIVAFFSMPYDKELVLSQPLALPVSSALVIVPEGIEVKSDQLTDDGIQQTQQGFNVQMYSSDSLSAGSPLEMTLSGKVKSAAAGSVDNRQTLLIGAGMFGVVLILAGVWMFLRNRNKLDEDDFEGSEEDEDEFETAEEVMDAIIALDDLHRAKKIPDEAYRARRAELKERLKELA